MAAQKNRAPLTDLDRRVIDTARRLTPEELELVIYTMRIINRLPAARQETLKAFIENERHRYKLTTVEGRAAFMSALQAF